MTKDKTVLIHHIHKWPPCNFEKLNNGKDRVKMSHYV